jgi:hypothetical protein
VGHYRIYCLDGANTIASADWVEAADDAAALRAVKKRFARQKCEIWDGPRLVGQVDTRPAG